MTADRLIAWTDAGGRVEADPAVTIALDRSAWERVGAVFTEVDDGQGERPGLATATVRTMEGPIAVGVVDYGEDSTYLLVPGVEPERGTTTQAVLHVLAADGVVDLDRDVLDIARTPSASTMLHRVERLERELERLRTPRPAPYPTVAHAEAVAAAPHGEVATGGASTATQHKTGTVTFIDHAKGYGYITPDDGGPDVFFTQHDVVAIARGGSDDLPPEASAESAHDPPSAVDPSPREPGHSRRDRGV